MMQQRIHQRLVRGPRRGVNHHARGFVDHNQIIIFKQHIKGDILRHCGNLGALHDMQHQHIPLGHLGAGAVQHRAIAPDRTIGDHAHQPRTRQRRLLWHITRQGLIKARRRVRPDDDLQLCKRRFCHDPAPGHAPARRTIP